MQRSLPAYPGRSCLLMALLITASLILPLMAVGQSAQTDNPSNPVQRTWVMTPTLSGQTAPLYSIKDKYVSRGFKEAEDVKLPPWLQNATPADPQFKDKALQTSIGPMVGVTLGMSFDGIGEGFVGPNGTYSVDSVPPDSDMAVGTTQVISLDNSAFAVFDKGSAAVLAGPFSTNVLWQALGSGACYNDNDGDGVVKFDQLAQRWIITQFAVTDGGTTGPFADCVAISQHRGRHREPGRYSSSTPARVRVIRTSRITPSWEFGQMSIR